MLSSSTLQTIREQDFQEMETVLLSQIMDTSKAIIESFKFRMIYGVNIDESQNKKTLTHLKDFRTKHWDTSLPKNQAYKEYLIHY